MNNSTEHEIVGWDHVADKIAVRCKCGDNWSHPLNTTVEKIESIFQSHVAYANRMTTRVD